MESSMSDLDSIFLQDKNLRLGRSKNFSVGTVPIGIGTTLRGHCRIRTCDPYRVRVVL